MYDSYVAYLQLRGFSLPDSFLFYNLYFLVIYDAQAL